jgi:hypothetical protein
MRESILFLGFVIVIFVVSLPICQHPSGGPPPNPEQRSKNSTTIDAEVNTPFQMAVVDGRRHHRGDLWDTGGP